MILGLQKRKIIRQVFYTKISIFDFHRGANVNLNSQNTIQGASFFVKIDQVSSRNIRQSSADDDSPEPVRDNRATRLLEIPLRVFFQLSKSDP